VAKPRCWVDAELALNKLRQTPSHVSAFVEENEEEVQNERRNHDYVLHQIQMDIGAGLNVTFDMLQDSGSKANCQTHFGRVRNGSWSKAPHGMHLKVHMMVLG
jgi:hypothetical protein